MLKKVASNVSVGKRYFLSLYERPETGLPYAYRSSAGLIAANTDADR